MSNTTGLRADEAQLSPIAPVSMTREVAGRLIDYISASGLQPGGRLPAERKLAEELRISRSAVRETLAALEVLGLIESRPGSGTYLRTNSSDLLPTVINWALAFRQTRTLDLVETRAHLEVVIVGLAAQRRTSDGIARLGAHLAKMNDSSTSLAEFVEADVAFHLEIAEMANNSALTDILHSVRSLLQVWVERAVKSDGQTEPTIHEHRHVYNAIVDGDVEAAKAAMQEHMDSASARLRRSLTSETTEQ